MSPNVGFSAVNYYNSLMALNGKNKGDANTVNNSLSPYMSNLNVVNNSDMLYNALNAMATQNGMPANSTNNQNTQQIAGMLEAGNKEAVKDMGAQAVPSLMAIVKDTSQPMQVRIDAIATLAKLVDEGKAPASCLVQLLKDPNCKDMAERAMANVGKEIMPVVKQMLNDPSMRESAINILNDMKDAWAGYENDPKWGQECQELLPEVDKLLNEINNSNNSNNNDTTNNTNNNNTQDNDDNSKYAGFTRQYVDFSKFIA